MAIDTLAERPIPLTQAARLIPRRRAGRKCNVATLYRWSVVGCRGTVLETIQIGGTRCTSREALQRFFDRLTAQSSGEPIPEPLPRARAADVRRAERILDVAGI